MTPVTGRMKSGPKPDVGSIRRGLTQAIDLTDWRAAMQSTRAYVRRRPDETPWDYLLRRSMRDPETGCIRWTGPTNKRGLGCVSIDGHVSNPQRAAYEIARGPIPKGSELRHDATTGCRYRDCFNPDHLEAVRVRFQGGNILDHLHARAVRDVDTGCLRWTGAHNRSGYGQLKLDTGRVESVHRLAYEAAFGPIPDGLHIDHVFLRGCRFRDCIEPSHLEAVTPEENVRRTPPERRRGHRNVQ